MISTLQGIIIIAVLVALLVGILIGYFSVQGRLRRQSEALKESQNRLSELETSYEGRLRTTTQTLRRDYEAELAETIEHYQDQLSDKTLELHQTYETRLKVLQEGLVMPIEAETPSIGRGNGIEPIDDNADTPLSRPEVLHLKRQYEIRLKEAAQKLQQAYEKQLAQHAKTVTADLQADYEKRLADKIEHYDKQSAIRQAQLEQEYASRYEALSQAQAIASEVESQALQSQAAVLGSKVPTPSEIMGTGNETTVTLQPKDRPSFAPTPSQPLVALPTQEDIDARIREATKQIRHDYEQQLSTKLEEYQAQLTARVQELEEDYRHRLNAIANIKPEFSSTNTPDNGGDLEPLDLSDISPSN